MWLGHPLLLCLYEEGPGTQGGGGWGMPGFPSAQPHLALNGLVLFGLELTVVCAF